MESRNNMGELNKILFDQLRALREVDYTDPDKLNAVIEQSKQVESLGKTVIESMNTVIRATEVRGKYTLETIHMPKMLEG